MPDAQTLDGRKISAESVIEFLHYFEALANQENFDLLEDQIHEQAFFRFNDGDFRGRSEIRAVFEKTWRGDPSVRKSRFFLSDIVVLTTDARTASATYSYTWEGSVSGQSFLVQGRGTRVLEAHGSTFQIVHEHLSRVPRVT